MVCAMFARMWDVDLQNAKNISNIVFIKYIIKSTVYEKQIFPKIETKMIRSIGAR